MCLITLHRFEDLTLNLFETKLVNLTRGIKRYIIKESFFLILSFNFLFNFN